MTHLPNIINYFRDCYQADFRAVHVADFFGKKVSHQHVLQSAELLTGSLLQVPVSTEWGIKTQKHLAIYGKEKTLFCCSFFIQGKTSVFGRPQPVFAPLYLHPLELVEEEEVFYLELDAQRPIMNPAFLECLNGFLGNKELTYDQFVEGMPVGFINFDQCHDLEKALSGFFPELNLGLMEKFPEILPMKEVEKIRKEKSENFTLLPAIGIGVIDKATSSLGILNELETLSSRDSFSLPLRALFGDQIKDEALPESSFVAPVTLSTAQQEIIHSAEKHSLTLAIGPPGTGKSFTIAALAVDFLVQGKSVLIAARNNQAVNVVADKIEEDFGLKDVVVRAGKKDYKVSLRKRLENLLYGMGLMKIGTNRMRLVKTEFHELERKVNDLQKRIIKKEQSELNRGQFLLNFQGSFWQKIKKVFIHRKLKNEIPFWKKLFQLEDLVEKRHEKAQRLIQNTSRMQIFQVLLNFRSELQVFLDGLKKRTGLRREESFQYVNFQKVLSAFPIWVVNTGDINRVLPLQAELFDLVIIDEATQCDMASAIPILFRGRKAAIVGDPKQLRHVSFLPQKQQRYFQKQNGLEAFPYDVLNYRVKSLLDLAFSAIKNQEQVHFLDEHYRSMPDIIAFSNNRFYDDNLKIMTLSPVTKEEQCVFLNRVEGRHYAKGHNAVEANAILEKVKQIVQYEATFAEKLCQSIGILSPFRAQVNYLRNLFNKEFSLDDLRRHRMLIGTPFEFQGEERDFMFLSFVVDKNTHPSTFVYLNREDVFNVSITRARSLQRLYYSIDFEDLNPKYLLTRYLKSISIQNLQLQKSAAQIAHDDFMKEVTEVIKSWKLNKIFHAHHIAGLEIDLVIIRKEKTYCIDLIGYPGDHEGAIPLHKWKMLSRVGLRIFALPYSYWVLEREKCLRGMRNFLGFRK